MEQAILGIVGLMLMVVLHQDRARRADITGLRQDMTDLRKDMTDGFAAHREETRKLIEASAARTDTRIDNLTTAVIDLAKAVGKVEGRTETLKLVE